MRRPNDGRTQHAHRVSAARRDAGFRLTSVVTVGLAAVGGLGTGLIAGAVRPSADASPASTTTSIRVVTPSTAATPSASATAASTAAATKAAATKVAATKAAATRAAAPTQAAQPPVATSGGS